MTKELLTGFLMLFIMLSACTEKVTEFDAYGGDLPGSYITIQADGSFAPRELTVVSGTPVSFVNNDTKPHNILSSDGVSIVTNIIAPRTFFKLKNDALVGSFPYRCVLDSFIKGTVIFTP
jgi:plastocyanin